jgi:hypothetical protein
MARRIGAALQLPFTEMDALHHGPAWTPRPLHTVFTDPEHVVRWAWRTRHLARELVPALEVTHPQLVIIRLHSRSDVDRFVTHLSSGVA